MRVLYGKPLHEKPKVGKAPAYVREDSGAPASPVGSKFAALRQAVLQGKPSVEIYRHDFLEACIEFADALRVRERPNVESLGEKVLADCGKLKQVRDHIVDWVLLEAPGVPSDRFTGALLQFLERLRELKSRPSEVNSWSDSWFEAHSLFVYETFLYIVAALLKADALPVIHEIFSSHYLLPEADRRGGDNFDNFGCFYGYSDTLQSVLAPSGQRLLSPAAELIKRQADRKDLPFGSIIEAELLVLMMAFIVPDARWYPQTFYYASHGRDFPFFLRATQHKNFEKLAKITGINDADELRAAVKEGEKRLDIGRWQVIHFSRSFWDAMNLDRLDSLK